MNSIGDPVGYVERTFGLRMRRVTGKEWAGPCPWCGGRDRFHVWDRGNYLCRPGDGHCGRSGWLDELEGASSPSEEERLRWRVAALEQRVKEHDDRLGVLERMAKCTDHLTYHQNLQTDGMALDYWLGEGFYMQTIEKFILGYCPSCPTYPPSPSYTIPVTYQGTLYNIRHRLKQEKAGKYRPHIAGLPAMLFNADALRILDKTKVLIVEGEKKAMIVEQETGLPAVAIMGKQSFKPEWASKLAKFSAVYVAYDPDATIEAQATAALFKGRGRLVRLPVKADDFFVNYGGNKDQFASYLNTARPVA